MLILLLLLLLLSVGYSIVLVRRHQRFRQEANNFTNALQSGQSFAPTDTLLRQFASLMASAQSKQKETAEKELQRHKKDIEIVLAREEDLLDELDSLDKIIEEQQQTIEQLEQKINDADKALTQTEATHRKQQSAITAHLRTIDDLKQEKEAVQAEYKRLIAQIEDSRRQVSEEREHFNTVQQQLQKELQALHNALQAAEEEKQQIIANAELTEKSFAGLFSEQKREITRLQAKNMKILQESKAIKSKMEALENHAAVERRVRLNDKERLEKLAEEYKELYQKSQTESKLLEQDFSEVLNEQQKIAAAEIDELRRYIAQLEEQKREVEAKLKSAELPPSSVSVANVPLPSATVSDENVFSSFSPQEGEKDITFNLASNDLNSLVSSMLETTATVLVVDDSPTNLRVLSMMLAHENFTILQAATGREAVKIALEKLPDIVLLDLILPDINGMEVLDELNKHRETENIPVLLLSSVGDTETKIEGFARGAVDYITKPFQQSEVVARLRAHRRVSIMEQALRQMINELQGQYKLEEQRREDLSRINKELQEARDAANEANKAKSAFLASMSHELRTPLNAIIGFAQILQRDAEIPPRQRTYVETMYKSGNHLLDMINDVLDLSKIEAGHMTVQIETFDLRQFLADVESMFTLRCKEKSLYLRFSQAGNIPRFIESDPNKLRQVFINLIGNAVKFTKEGGITVTAEKIINQTTQEELLRFSIIDTGRGIPADQIDSVLQPFKQVETKKMKSEGTGLGLSISNKIATLLGGTLTVESEEGVGSNFSFSVKLIAGEEEELLNPDDDAEAEITGILNSEQYTVLIVDDSKTNRAIVREIMLPIGFHCIEAENGAEAFDMFKSEKPDIVLSDIVMPVMDGIESMKLMREYEKEHNLPKTPIIALSASVLSSRSDELIRDGFDDFLGKPFLLKDFYNILAHRSNIQFITRSKEAIYIVEKAEGQVSSQAGVFSVNELAAFIAKQYEDTLDDVIDLFEMHIYDEIEALLAKAEPNDEESTSIIRYLSEKAKQQDMILFTKLAEELY